MLDPRRQWSALHHGIDPDAVPVLRLWLRLIWTLAAPLARLGIAPTALTLLGAVSAVSAAGLASSAPWVAGALVLLAVLGDGLDGAVAIFAGRASARGAVADKAADRIADSAFAMVLWQCGAPWFLAVAAGVMSLAHEGFRELRGGTLRAQLTVAERPTRTICTLLACGCAGVSSGSWLLTVCAAVWVAAGVAGFAQLVRAASGGVGSSS